VTRAKRFLLAAGAIGVCAPVVCFARRPDWWPYWMMTNIVLENRCLEANDDRACVDACARGLPGEGGCLTAGQRASRLVTPAGSDEPGDDVASRKRIEQVALEYFQKACDRGAARGCVEASYSTADRLARLHLYDRACSLGDAPQCRTTGDLALGSDKAMALSGYARWCALPGDTSPLHGASCLTERTKLVTDVERERAGCAGHDARACERFGDLLAAQDDDRSFARNRELAIEAFSEACTIRGIDLPELWPELEPGECGNTEHLGIPGAPPQLPDPRARCGFARAEDSYWRARQPRLGALFGALAATSKPAAGQPPRGVAMVAMESLQTRPGDYAQDAVAARLRAMLPAARACVAIPRGDAGAGAWRLRLDFVIDHLGEVDLMTESPVAGAAWPYDGTHACIVASLRGVEGATFAAPTDGIARVESILRFDPGPAAP
jgi:hypothetical protein